jgi:DNA-binding SARP family transcriptional activator
LLGGLDVEGVEGPTLGSRKARTLVKMLALARGSAVSADAVVEALWPGDDLPAKPVEQVGVLVSRLRSVLGADRLPRTDAGWTLAVDWLDVVELEARVDEAVARIAAGNPTAARAAARAALALVQGELLADEIDPFWAETDRHAVARTVARARLIGAEAALVAGDGGEAAALAERALDHDPYDEAVLRVLMRAHAVAGRPASALAAYARTRERLAADMGVDPAEDTEALHTAILLGEEDRAGPATAASGVSSVVPRLVGRGDQLAALSRLLSRARAGDCVLAVVEGEAGIGTSRTVPPSPRSVGGGRLALASRGFRCRGRRALGRISLVADRGRRLF